MTQQNGAVSILHSTNCWGASAVVWNPRFVLVHLVVLSETSISEMIWPETVPTLCEVICSWNFRSCCSGRRDSTNCGEYLNNCHVHTVIDRFLWRRAFGPTRKRVFNTSKSPSINAISVGFPLEAVWRIVFVSGWLEEHVLVGYGFTVVRSRCHTRSVSPGIAILVCHTWSKLKRTRCGHVYGKTLDPLRDTHHFSGNWCCGRFVISAVGCDL